MKLVNIDKIYINKNNQVHALKKINICLNTTGMTFVVGKSGSGKTTLLNIISKKDNEYSGTLELEGTIEVIDQDIILMENMTVLENLLLVNDDRVYIKQMLQQFLIEEIANKKVKLLSIGQKKRVQIIRSLIVDFTYLLCDEPTAALDYENIDIVMSVLQRLATHKAVIIVTHDMCLVEKYANRVITINNGKIQSDQVRDKKKIVNDTLNSNTKSRMKQINFALKTMKTRPLEMIVKTCLIFTMLLTIFVFTTMFTSMDSAITNKNMWRYGENIIITQPNEGNDIYQGSSTIVNEKQFYYYDVYDKETIRLIRDNVQGVIGYRCGWNQRYSMLDGSFSPDMNIEDLKKAVSEGDRIQAQTNEVPYEQYTSFKSLLQDILQKYPDGNVSKTQVLTVDFRNFEGFKKDNDLGYQYPLLDTITIGYYNTEVKVYQMFDNYKMQLRYGTLPKSNEEVLLSSNVANNMMKEYKLRDSKEMIGKIIPVYVDHENEATINVKVSGISYEESFYENQIYFKEGAWDSIIEKKYEMIPEKLKYQYVYFICDESKEADKVANQINQVLNSQNSEFVSYNNSFMTGKNKVEYSNPIYFYIFSLLVSVALIVIYILIKSITIKRLKKEYYIFKRYGYAPFAIFSIPVILLLTICICMQMSSLSFVCQQVNALANTIGFAAIIEYKFSQYLIAIIVTIVIIVLIEGGYYVFRIKKYK